MLKNSLRLINSKRFLKSQSNSFSSLTCDVLIVGGGAHGANIAYQLSKKGINDVVVLEQDTSYQYASSVLSAGGIRQQFSLEENIRMSIYGANFLKNMPEELKTKNGSEPGETDPQFHQNGYLFLAGDKSKQILENNLKVQNSCGADWLYSLGPDDLKSKFPWLNLQSDVDLNSYYNELLDSSSNNIPLLDRNAIHLSGEEISQGVFSTKNEGYFDPWTLINATRNKAKENGVSFLHARGTKASGVVKKNSVSNCLINNFVAQLNSDQTIRNQFYKKDEEININSKVVVLASGAWTGELFSSISKSLMPANPHSLFPIPVKPRKRCIFMGHCPDVQVGKQEPSLGFFERQRDGTEIPINKSPLVVDPTGCYFRPENKPGHFLFGVSPGRERDAYMAMRHRRDNNSSEDPYYFHDTYKSYHEDIEKDLGDVDFNLFYDVIWPTMASRIPLFNNIKLISSWAGYYDVNTLDEVMFINFLPTYFYYYSFPFF